LPFRNAPNLIQVETPPSLNVLGLFCGTKERIRDHQDRCNAGTGHGENNFPVREQSFQLKISLAANELWRDACQHISTLKLTTHKKNAVYRDRPTGLYFTETAAG
jgi:hypothetical protein